MENQPAGFWVRFLAIFIDGLMITAITWTIAAFITGEVEQLMQTDRPGDTYAGAFSELMYSIIFIIVFTGSRYMGSPGKLICGIQVSNEDGSQISLPKSIGRYFSYILSVIPLMIGFMMAGWTQEKKALHDYICKTIVTYRNK